MYGCISGTRCSLTPECELDSNSDCPVEQGDDFELSCWCPAETEWQAQTQTWTINGSARPNFYGKLKPWIPVSGGKRSTLKVKKASKIHSGEVCCFLNFTGPSRPDPACIDISVSVRESSLPHIFNSTITLVGSIPSNSSTNGTMKYNVTVNCEYFTSQQQELCNGFSAVAVDGELYPTSNSPESKCEELEKAVKYNLLHVGLGSNITCLFMSYARSSPEIYVSEPLAVPGKYPNGNSKSRSNLHMAISDSYNE